MISRAGGEVLARFSLLRLIGFLLFFLGMAASVALDRTGPFAADWIRPPSLGFLGFCALMFLAMLARAALLRGAAVYIADGRLRWVSLFYIGNLKLSLTFKR